MTGTRDLPRTAQPMPPGGLRAVLRHLGAPDEYGNPAPAYTGRVVIHSGDRHGFVYMRYGKVYAVHYSRFTPPLARRMRTGGLIDDATYARLAAMAPEEVGPYVITEQLVGADAVENINRQMLLSSLTHLYEWPDTTWCWEPDVTTNVFQISPLEPSLVVAATEERKGQWDALARNYPHVCTGDAVPLPGAAWADRDVHAPPEITTIYRHINGDNTVAYIAGVCGLTRFELAGRLAKAVADDTVTFAGLTPLHDDDEVAALVDDYLEAAAAAAAARARYEDAQKTLAAAEDALTARKIPIPAEFGAVPPADNTR